MKTWMGTLLVTATILAPSLTAQALKPANNPTNDITITSVNTVPNCVTVAGAYTIAPGYTFRNITVCVRPNGGLAGEGGEGEANVEGGSFSTTILVPSPATYEVQAMLEFKDDKGESHFFVSNAILRVTVPPAP